MKETAGMKTLEVLRRHHAHSPRKIVVATAAATYTYEDLDALITNWSEWLKRHPDLRKTSLAVMSSNTCDYLALFLAAWSERITIIPLDPSLRKDELEKVLGLTRPAIKLVQRGLRDDNLAALGFHVLESVQDLSVTCASRANEFSEEIAVVYVTSGSTGDPKGVLLSFDALEARSHLIASDQGIRESDRVLCPIPITNSYAMDLILPSLRTGASVLLLDPWLANPSTVFRLIERERITISTAVPLFYRLSLRMPATFHFNLSSVRIFHSGSSALDETVARSFKDRFGHYIHQGYGLVEAGFSVFNQKAEDQLCSSIGTVLPGIGWELSDEGELVLSGPPLFSGYLNADSETKKILRGGKLYTGDLVRCDEHGNLWFEGRSDQRINISGIKVFPEAIEIAALKHPSVKLAAVTSEKDDLAGERPVLNVVLEKFPESDGDKRLCRAELVRFLQEHISPSKCPREIRFYRELPLSPLNKVLKHLIRRDD